MSEVTTVGSILRTGLLADRRGLRLAGSSLGFIVHQACEAAVPVVIGLVIDRAVSTGDRTALAVWIGVLAGVFVLLSLSYQSANQAMVRTYSYGEHDLRLMATERVLHPRGLAARRGVGDVLSVTVSDTYRVAGIAWSIAEQSATIAAITVAAAVLLTISIPLGAGVFVGAFAVLWLMQRLAMPLERLGMTEQASVARASEIATDTFRGIRTVQGLNAEQESVRRYRAASAASRDGAVASGRSLLTYESVSDMVSVIYMAVLSLVAAWMAVDGAISVGQLVMVVGLAQFLQGSLAHVGTFGANWAHKRASAGRLHGLIGAEFALPAAGSGTPGPDSDAILTWSPRGGSTIEIQRGQLVGIRVHSARQAREVSARLGYRTPIDAGELALYGVDAVGVGPSRYAEYVLAPPHDAVVFSGSIADNVAHGPLRPPLLAACAVDDVVEQLGVDAEVGESGHRLSGGQRQRVALARALHAPADVLVLDEPTTALDPVTELRVAAGLRASGRTIAVVTSSRILLDACSTVVDVAEVPA